MKHQDDTHVIIESLKQGLITSSQLVSLIELKPFEVERHPLSEISTNLLHQKRHILYQVSERLFKEDPGLL